jgi:anthranilate phosphoribosyltransferase
VTATLDDLGGWPAVLGALQANSDLAAEQTEAVLGTVLSGEATDAQIAAFIIALRQKGETTDELTGLVRAMRAAATPLSMPEGTIDIVGMGGAPSRRKAALNVSTMACFVAVAAGATVCKHGNRKISSTSGSFDLLEVLGVNFDVSPERLEALVSKTGLGFAFARTFHPAMRHVGPVRMELGIPTVFNALGPLAHPAKLERQLVGVADDSLADRMIDVLRSTGSTTAWVVTGDGPLDELSTTGPTTVRRLQHGEITTEIVDPGSYGLAAPKAGDLDGGDANANAAIMKALFAGQRGAVRDIVLLNTAAALVVAGIADDLAEGLELGSHALDSGAASAKLDEHIAAAA